MKMKIEKTAPDGRPQNNKAQIISPPYIPIVSSNNSFKTTHAASGLEVAAMTCMVFFLPVIVFACPPAFATVASGGGIRSNARKVDTYSLGCKTKEC